MSDSYEKKESIMREKGSASLKRDWEEGPFFRCHKSYLINLEKVREVFPWGNNSLGVKMEGYDKTVIPVGREKTKDT